MSKRQKTRHAKKIEFERLMDQLSDCVAGMVAEEKCKYARLFEEALTAKTQILIYEKEIKDKQEAFQTLQRENIILEEKMRKLREEKEKAEAFLARAEEESEQRQLKYEAQMKELQRLAASAARSSSGDEVPLKTVISGFKKRAKLHGMSHAAQLFDDLNQMLISVPAWKEATEKLEAFFDEERKRLDTPRNVVEQLTAQTVSMDRAEIKGALYEVKNNEEVNIGNGRE